jgi:hypothetical protein
MNMTAANLHWRRLQQLDEPSAVNTCSVIVLQSPVVASVKLIDLVRWKVWSAFSTWNERELNPVLKWPLHWHTCSTNMFVHGSWFSKMRVRSAPVMISMIQSCMLVLFYCAVGVAARFIDAWPAWTSNTFMFDVAFTRTYMFVEHPENFNTFERSNMFVEHVRHSRYTGIHNREHVRPCKGCFTDHTFGVLPTALTLP